MVRRCTQERGERESQPEEGGRGEGERRREGEEKQILSEGNRRKEREKEREREREREKEIREKVRERENERERESERRGKEMRRERGREYLLSSLSLREKTLGNEEEEKKVVGRERGERERSVMGSKRRGCGLRKKGREKEKENGLKTYFSLLSLYFPHIHSHNTRTNTQTHRHRHTDTHTDTHTQTHRHTHTHTHRHRHIPEKPQGARTAHGKWHTNPHLLTWHIKLAPLPLQKWQRVPLALLIARSIPLYTI